MIDTYNNSLVEQFAQVRKALETTLAIAKLHKLPTDLADNSLAALSVIERHVQDMEKALRDQAEPIMDERFRDRLLRHVLSNEEVAQLVDAIYQQQTRALNALAALPAREKGTD